MLKINSFPQNVAYFGAKYPIYVTLLVKKTHTSRYKAVRTNFFYSAQTDYYLQILKYIELKKDLR